MDWRGVRGSGIWTAEGFLFELSGGDPALDLPNTLDRRRTKAPVELLPDYAALLDWAHQAGLVDSETAAKFRRAARRDSASAAAAHRRALRLRDDLFALFAAFAEGRRPPRDSLHRLDVLRRRAAGRTRLRLEPDRSVRLVPPSPAGLDEIVFLVVESAVALLTSDAVARVRVCSGATCAWLFLDRSPQGNRRWCDMTICGNRAKARRHYQRRRRTG